MGGVDNQNELKLLTLVIYHATYETKSLRDNRRIVLGRLGRHQHFFWRHQSSTDPSIIITLNECVFWSARRGIYTNLLQKVLPH